MFRSPSELDKSVVRFLKVPKSVLQFVSAVTWSCGPNPWRRFTHGPLTTAKFPFRVRGNRTTSMATEWGGRVDMERGPDGG